MRRCQHLILLALLSLPLSAQLPSRPPVDTDEACSVTCGDEPAGSITADIPTYEEIAAIGDLARSWLRLQVYKGRVPTPWPTETIGDIIWMSPPTKDWRPWRFPVQYCSRQFRIMATLPGGGTGLFCASGAAYSDRVVISLSNPANVRALIGWEQCNGGGFWKFGLQAPGQWADGPMVAECSAWINATLAGPGRTAKSISAEDIKKPAPAPKKKEIPE